MDLKYKSRKPGRPKKHEYKVPRVDLVPEQYGLRDRPNGVSENDHSVVFDDELTDKERQILQELGGKPFRPGEEGFGNYSWEVRFPPPFEVIRTLRRHFGTGPNGNDDLGKSRYYAAFRERISEEHELLKKYGTVNKAAAAVAAANDLLK